MIPAIILYPAGCWAVGFLGDILIQKAMKGEDKDISYGRAAGVGALCCVGAAAAVGIRATAAAGSALKAAAGAAAGSVAAETAAASTVAAATVGTEIALGGAAGVTVLTGGSVVLADFISRLEKRFKSTNVLKVTDGKLYYMGKLIPDEHTKVFIDAYKEGVL